MTIVERLVPERLWDLTQGLMPPPPSRPQGGGRPRADDRAVLAAIVFVATTGCAWRDLPPCFGASWQTAHRRYTEWTRSGLWPKLRRAVIAELEATAMLDWSRVAVDAVAQLTRQGTG